MSPSLWENRFPFLERFEVVVQSAGLGLHAAGLARPEFNLSTPQLLAGLVVNISLIDLPDLKLPSQPQREKLDPILVPSSGSDTNGLGPSVLEWS